MVKVQSLVEEVKSHKLHHAAREKKQVKCINIYITLVLIKIREIKLLCPNEILLK